MRSNTRIKNLGKIISCYTKAVLTNGSLAIRTPYKAQEIELNSAIKIGLSGRAAVERSFMTVGSAASGAATFTADIAQPT